MASSERKRKWLKVLSDNNVVGVLVAVVLSGFFGPQVGGLVGGMAEKAADARVEQHCEKHGGCE